MAIYNREVQAMTCEALKGCRIGKDSEAVKTIYAGVKDTSTLSVTARQTGPTIRFHWRHDGDRISKKDAVRFMRHHEEVERYLSASAEPTCCGSCPGGCPIGLADPQKGATPRYRRPS